MDEVDAEKVRDDRRLPFGLPGVNKAGKVSNANYLWLQYFYSYLSENDRAGVVMSSQASSAGRNEAKVRQKLVEAWEELACAEAIVSTEIEALTDEVAARATDWSEGTTGGSRDNSELHAVPEGLRDMAERCRDLTKEIDRAAKLAGRVVDIAVRELDARDSGLWANADINKARRGLESVRADAVEALRQARYFVRQADWLQERFPEAEVRDVEGLVKLVDRAEIEAHDWSLTPGRYVGVAPAEEDEDFDFEAALRSIHMDLKELNDQAAKLATRIDRNFEKLGV